MLPAYSGCAWIEPRKKLTVQEAKLRARDIETQNLECAEQFDSSWASRVRINELELHLRHENWEANGMGQEYQSAALVVGNASSSVHLARRD